MPPEDTIYLDHAATTSVAPDVIEAMLPFLGERFANPAGAYRSARTARAALDAARETVARTLGAAPGEIVFTSGGTESDNLAVAGVARAMRRAGRGGHIVTTAVEHEAVLEAVRSLAEHENFEVTVVGVDGHGRVAVADVLAAVRPDTVLVSVMLANNVVGTLQPVPELGKALRARGVFFHSDAVQAPLWLDLSVDRLHVDALSVSGHKCHGPKGVGALYVRSGTPIVPLLHGGGQEGGLRSGTSNVAGAVGLAAALARASAGREAAVAHVAPLRDQFAAGMLAIEGVRLTGHPVLRLPNHASFVVADAPAELVLLGLDRHGICAASSAACATGKHAPSAVLVALGLPAELAAGALRFTLGPGTTAAEIARVQSLMPSLIEKIRGSDV